MGHPRVPKAVRRQGFGQLERVAVGDEPGVDLRRLDPPAALGQPQCRMILAAELGPDVVHVVGHRLHRPPHHRGHVASPGWLPAHRLAVAHVQHPVPAELRRRRVAAPVGHIQLGRLGAAKRPGVDDFEQGGVAVGSQCPLALGPNRPVDLIVGVVQEALQLVPRERAGLRVALVVVEMSDRVPLVADRHRERAERLLALDRPPVPAVGEVLAEQPQIGLVATDRRRSEMLLTGQRLRPLVHMRRSPAPRVLVGELQEPPHQPLPRSDRVLLQPTRGLLGPPALQHRLDHGVLGTQLHHTGDELKTRGARQITSSHKVLQARGARPSKGRIMHLTESSRKQRRSGSVVQRAHGPIAEARSSGDLRKHHRLMQFPRVGVPQGHVE
jgi:hypothetical protein